MPKYDAEYFIEKFKKIPSSRWCEKVFKRGNKCCAYGHLGRRSWNDKTPEMEALAELLEHNVSRINDNRDGDYPQKTPQARILAALHQIQAQTKSEKE